jgi:cytochrome bd-type quinol oxidase subunit 2
VSSAIALLSLLALGSGSSKNMETVGATEARWRRLARICAWLLLPLPALLAFWQRPVDAAIAEAVSVYLLSGLAVTLLGQRAPRTLLALGLVTLGASLLLEIA